MVWSATTITLDGRERRHVQSTTRRRRARRKPKFLHRIIGTHARDMPKMAAILHKKKGGQNRVSHNRSDIPPFYGAYIAFLVGALQAERGAFRLDVADAAARVALFGRDGARLCACRRFVARFTAVVAEPLLRRTVLSDMANCS
jgi:hypothetical protein